MHFLKQECKMDDRNIALLLFMRLFPALFSGSSVL